MRQVYFATAISLFCGSPLYAEDISRAECDAIVQAMTEISRLNVKSLEVLSEISMEILSITVATGGNERVAELLEPISNLLTPAPEMDTQKVVPGLQAIRSVCPDSFP